MLKPLDDDGGVVSISVEVRCLCGGLSRTVAAVIYTFQAFKRTRFTDFKIRDIKCIRVCGRCVGRYAGKYISEYEHVCG